MPSGRATTAVFALPPVVARATFLASGRAVVPFPSVPARAAILPASTVLLAHVRKFPAAVVSPARCYHPPALPNIKQQEKRVRQASRQRLENLRWRSTAKTLMRRLKEADAEDVEKAHRELVSWLDKAATRGALHRNTAARRKAQAAKLLEKN